MRCAVCARRVSYVNVQGGRENVQRSTLQREDFSVDQHGDGNGNFEFDMLHCFSRSERMANVSAVVEFGQHAEKTQAADGSPANEFDEAVGGIGVGRDEHRAAGEFAVVECEEQAAAGVPFLFVVGAQDQCAAVQLNNTDEDPQ